MKEREYVYRILLTYDDGSSYHMKNGKIYQNIGPARRIAACRIGMEERMARGRARNLERNKDYVFTGVKLKSVKIVPYALSELNDNTIHTPLEGKFLYEYKEDESPDFL